MINCQQKSESKDKKFLKNDKNNYLQYQNVTYSPTADRQRRTASYYSRAQLVCVTSNLTSLTIIPLVMVQSNTTNILFLFFLFSYPNIFINFIISKLADCAVTYFRLDPIPKIKK